MRITKRAVDATEPGAKHFVVWDDDVKGFGLSVQPTGHKSYIFKYRTREEGEQRRMTLGNHGDITADEARKLAAEARRDVLLGADPLGERRAKRDALTVGDLLDRYLDSAEFADKASITQYNDRSKIDRHLRPLLGKRHAHQVTDSDVRRAFTAIAEGKTSTDVRTGPRGRAIVRGGRGAAREAIVRLSIAFNWGIRQKLVSENPCLHVKLQAVGSRETILEDAAGYATMFKAIDRLETMLAIRSEAADAVRFIALTGCRRGEATKLRWRHIEDGRIVLPPREHKAGKRTGKPRIIALGTAAQAVIARQQQGGPEDYVFTPGRGEGGSISLSRVWTKVRREAGLPAKLTLHGLRHSTASHMAMAGAEASEIMAVMGHSQLSTVIRYVHFARDVRSTLAQKAEAMAVAGMAAAHGKSGKVVRLKKTAK
jgi:integrase